MIILIIKKIHKIYYEKILIKLKMIVRNIYPNVTRVNQTKNYYIQQLNKMPRYSSNDKSNIPQNFNLDSNDNLNFLPKSKEYNSKTVENNKRKKLNHYLSKDRINDQLNLINYRKNFNIIGKKINKLKAFFNRMNLNDLGDINDLSNLDDDDDKSKKIKKKKRFIYFLQK